MLWVKSLHIVFMVTWLGGLLYLPRLFVYHAMADDRVSIERFKLMERKLYWGIMTPGAVLTIVFGVWLWLGWGLRTRPDPRTARGFAVVQRVPGAGAARRGVPGCPKAVLKRFSRVARAASSR